MQYGPYFLPLLVAVGILLGLALHAWRQREMPGAIPAAASLLAAAVVVLFAGLETASLDLATKLSWATARWPVQAVLPVLWLAMAIQFTGRGHWSNLRWLAALLIVPAITMSLALTTERHTWFRYDYYLYDAGPGPVMLYTNGPWFWVHLAFSDLLYGASLVLLALSLRHARPLYARQLAMVMGGTLFPLIADLLFQLGITPWHGYSLAPATLGLSGLLIGWALFRYRWLDIVPIARSIVVENMADPMLVLDAQNRVLDFNRAAQATIGFDVSQVVGQSAEAVLSPWADLGDRYRGMQSTRDEINVEGAEGRRVFDCSAAPIKSAQGRFLGRLVILHEITERRRAEEEIHLLLTMTQAIGGSRDFQSALGVGLQQVCEATGWNLGEAWVPTPDGTALECSPAWYCGGSGLEAFRAASEELRFPPGFGLPGRIWLSKQPEWIRDLSTTPSTIFFRTDIALKAGLKAGLGIPIIGDDQVLAVLVFFMFQAREEDRHLIDVVSAVATQLGTVMQRKHAEETLARLEANRRVIAAEERLRREIAELLHGPVQTKLLMAWFRLGHCQSLLTANPAAAEMLDEVRTELDRLREQEVRQASHLLHPAIIQVGLLPAIRSLVGRFEEHFSVGTWFDPELARLDSPDLNSIPEPTRLVAYRVVEEALNNVLRHAGASHVELRLGIQDHQHLAILVEDDGRGFDPKELKPGLGLSSIAARVEQLNGTWQISSSVGHGSRLSVVLPIKAP